MPTEHRIFKKADEERRIVVAISALESQEAMRAPIPKKIHIF
jgi:hypothetical protein